jgi:hypothetical protein
MRGSRAARREMCTKCMCASTARTREQLQRSQMTFRVSRLELQRKHRSNSSHQLALCLRGDQPRGPRRQPEGLRSERPLRGCCARSPWSPATIKGSLESARRALSDGAEKYGRRRSAKRCRSAGGSPATRPQFTFRRSRLARARQANVVASSLRGRGWRKVME